MIKNLKKIIIIILAFISITVLILIDELFTFRDPSVIRVDRQIVATALDDMRTTLTEKEYEMMVTISKDWEKNTDGKKYVGSANPNLKPENAKIAAIDLDKCGFNNAPMSMVIGGDEIGVKFVRDIIKPNTEEQYYEIAEYGICYFYDNDPYKFLKSDGFHAVPPYFSENLSYIEKIYDSLYIYIIYSDPLA